MLYFVLSAEYLMLCYGMFMLWYVMVWYGMVCLSYDIFIVVHGVLFSAESEGVSTLSLVLVLSLSLSQRLQSHTIQAITSITYRWCFYNDNSGCSSCRDHSISQRFPVVFSSYSKIMSTTGSSPATFVKYHGLGNDFILIDNTHSPVPTYTAVQAVKLCDRNFGIGADGIIFALPGENGCDFTMRIFNSDGSEPQMCGNGIRCLTKFLHDYVCKSTGKAPPDGIYTIWTLAGKIIAELYSDGNVKVNIGKPILQANLVPTLLTANSDGRAIESELEVEGTIYRSTAISMGNPHSVRLLFQTCCAH